MIYHPLVGLVFLSSNIKTHNLSYEDIMLNVNKIWKFEEKASVEK